MKDELNQRRKNSEVEGSRGMVRDRLDEGQGVRSNARGVASFQEKVEVERAERSRGAGSEAKSRERRSSRDRLRAFYTVCSCVFVGRVGAMETETRLLRRSSWVRRKETVWRKSGEKTSLGHAPAPVSPGFSQPATSQHFLATFEPPHVEALAHYLDMTRAGREVQESHSVNLWRAKPLFSPLARLTDPKEKARTSPAFTSEQSLIHPTDLAPEETAPEKARFSPPPKPINESSDSNEITRP